jgi:hypothetical protein
MEYQCEVVSRICAGKAAIGTCIGDGELACKPGSVECLAAFRQSFIWADSYLSARATYPGAVRAALQPPYLVLLRMGFAVPLLLPEARWALTPPFHHRRSRCRDLGSLFSVALSIASRRPVVNRHPALRSPDFPPRKRIAQRLPGQLPLPILRATQVAPVPCITGRFFAWRNVTAPPLVPARITSCQRDSAPLRKEAQNTRP